MAIRPNANMLLRGIALLLRMAILIYAAVNILFITANIAIGERLPIVVFYNTFSHVIWFPALILLPLCLFWRSHLWRWVLVGLTAVPAAAFIAIFAVRFLPHGGTSYTESQRAGGITVLNHNILGIQSDYEAIADFIRGSDADVVAVQEMNFLSAEYLASELADVYPYSALHPGQGTVGSGVWSKYPLRDSAFFMTDVMQTGLGHQRVIVELDSFDLVVYNVHPVPPVTSMFAIDPYWRSAEIRELLDRIANEGGDSNILMIGDFNMTDRNEDYARVTGAGFVDAYRRSGWGLGPTWPNLFYSVGMLGGATFRLPQLIRIDYQFYRDNMGDRFVLEAESARVGVTSGGSDHFPVRVEYGIYDLTAS